MLEIAPMKLSAADLALPAEALTADGVQLSLAGDHARFSLRARNAAVLEGLLGRKLPAKIGESLDGIACLGPDEWYALFPSGTALPLGEGLPVSVTEVSSRALGFVVEGPRAVELITSGCPLDVAKFPIGRATRTVFETVEIVVWRTGEARFHLEVWRSFAPWLWHALAAAA
jgi:sarcosine oxidase, subunit gamma